NNPYSLQARVMKLRQQNANVLLGQRPAEAANPPAKRAASKQVPGKTPGDNLGEPKAKRAPLSELTSKLTSGLVIDSVRKGLAGIRRQPTTSTTKTDDVVVEGRKTRSQSSKENASHKLDQGSSSSADDSIIILEKTDEEEDVVIVDPCPAYDYDAENKDNEFEVPEFATDVFAYHRAREVAYNVGDYMARHPRLSKDCRAMLVDWMIEVQETFELNHETLYLAVKLVDMFLDKTKKKVERNHLMLIASAAIFIASKYEERSPPLIDDFIYMSEDSPGTFTRKALEETERKLFETVAFDLGAPLSYSHLRRYAKASKVNMQTLTLARYILETSLMCYEFVQASESAIAAGAFWLALKMMNAAAEWTPAMHKYSGLAVEEVAPWAAALNHMLHVRNEGGGRLADQHTAFDKYSHEVFYHSAQVPLIKDKFKLKDAIQCPK
ncbi:hypothetical protein PENTCL1PPCAC_25494, partial [Pristionchus entomophagus]